MSVVSKRKRTKLKPRMRSRDFKSTRDFQEHFAELSRGWASVIRCSGCNQVVMIVIRDFTDIEGNYNEWDSDSKIVWCDLCKPGESS